MKNNILFDNLIILILGMVLFLSCDDKRFDHYDTPDWLKGSCWDVLEDDANYSIFLKGIELAGYKPLMKGKSILTVMAPDNEAFSF